MRGLVWIGLPEELSVPESECVMVAEYNGTIYHAHYDQGYSAKVMFNPATQMFYSIIKEGTTGPERRRYAHLR